MKLENKEYFLKFTPGGGRNKRHGTYILHGSSGHVAHTLERLSVHFWKKKQVAVDISECLKQIGLADSLHTSTKYSYLISLMIKEK